MISTPYWLAAALLFLVHQLLQYGLSVPLPLVDDYLDPLVGVPTLLGAEAVYRRYLFGQPRLSLLDVGVATLVMALVFELLFPRWQPRFVYDPLDFVMYGLGAMYFWWLVNPQQPAEKA